MAEPEYEAIERARLNALRRYALLDTPPERPFDALARLAVRTFGCPMAVLTLVDEGRQWFKSRVGLTITETERDIAFCAHTVERRQATVVLDAASEPRFAHNPLVVGSPFIRFYAGAPIVTDDGHAIGSFAVLDTRPHDRFAESDMRLLEDLAALARDAIELRHQTQTGEMLRSVVIHAKDGIVVMQPDRERARGAKIVYVNAAFAGLAGYPADALIGRHSDLLFGPDTDRRAIDELFASLEAGRPHQMDLTLHRSDGAARAIEVTAVPAHGGGGVGAHWVALCRDVTDRRALERGLVEAKRRAETASAAKSSFLANMSHELRTPLNAIIGFAEVIEGRLFGPLGAAKYDEYVADILRSSRLLLSLVDDLLDLAKVESGKVSLAADRVDGNGLIGEAIRLLAPQAEAHGVGLEWQPAADWVISGDRRALLQVLINIVGNAIKFSSRGGRVTVEAGGTPGGGTEICVRDQGIGMTEADAAGQPFGQASTAYTKPLTGAGLGLPLADRLVALHGGSMTIRSRHGEGTTVLITLPGPAAP
jgi:PAS domain S-box-containing protein